MDDIAPLTSAHAQDDVAAGSERPLVTFALFAYNQEQYPRGDRGCFRADL